MIPGTRRLQSPPRLAWTTEMITSTAAPLFHVGLVGLATRRPPNHEDGLWLLLATRNKEALKPQTIWTWCEITAWERIRGMGFTVVVGVWGLMSSQRTTILFLQPAIWNRFISAIVADAPLLLPPLAEYFQETSCRHHPRADWLSFINLPEICR